MTWRRTQPDELVQAWAVGHTVEVRSPGDTYLGETAKDRVVVDVRPQGRIDPAIILDGGGFLDGRTTGERVTWRVIP